MINACQSMQDFERLLQDSHARPVLLFKHSSACSTSARAWNHFKKFAEAESSADYWRVLAIEQRPLSRELAVRTGVAHASPQVLLLQNAKVVWHASHGRITVRALHENFQTLEKKYPDTGAG